MFFQDGKRHFQFFLRRPDSAHYRTGFSARLRLFHRRRLRGGTVYAAAKHELCHLFRDFVALRFGTFVFRSEPEVGKAKTFIPELFKIAEAQQFFQFFPIERQRIFQKIQIHESTNATTAAEKMIRRMRNQIGKEKFVRHFHAARRRRFFFLFFRNNVIPHLFRHAIVLFMEFAQRKVQFQRHALIRRHHIIVIRFFTGCNKRFFLQNGNCSFQIFFPHEDIHVATRTHGGIGIISAYHRAFQRHIIDLFRIESRINAPDIIIHPLVPITGKRKFTAESVGYLFGHRYARVQQCFSREMSKIVRVGKAIKRYKILRSEENAFFLRKYGNLSG